MDEEIKDLDLIEPTEEVVKTEPEFTEAEKKAYARAKKAEAEAKELKAKLKALEEVKDTNNPEADELRLLAKGLSDDEIAEAKSIAKGKDISLTEAIKTRTFQLFQEDLKEQERKEKAKLGASKGSTQADEQAMKPDMSREEHMAIWKKMGQ